MYSIDYLFAQDTIGMICNMLELPPFAHNLNFIFFHYLYKGGLDQIFGAEGSSNIKKVCFLIPFDEDNLIKVFSYVIILNVNQSHDSIFLLLLDIIILIIQTLLWYLK